MSLTTANLWDIVKKQYYFKLKANIDAFSSLVGIQLLALLFSLGGVASTGSGSGWLSVNIRYYSSDMVIAFTMIWGLVTAITITTKPYRNHDFTFVTNRLSSSLSNILYLLTASVIGGTTAMLASYLLRAIGFIFFDSKLFGFQVVAGEFILGIGITILYIFCMSAIGYFIGTLVQISKLFIVVFPSLIIGSIFIDAVQGYEPFVIDILQFYFMESSIVWFLVKIVITTALLFIASINILNKMEVRR